LKFPRREVTIEAIGKEVYIKKVRIQLHRLWHEVNRFSLVSEESSLRLHKAHLQQDITIVMNYEKRFNFSTEMTDGDEIFQARKQLLSRYCND